MYTHYVYKIYMYKCVYVDTLIYTHTYMHIYSKRERESIFYEMRFLESERLKGPLIVFLLAVTADVRSHHDLPNNGNTLFQKAQATNNQPLWQNAILMVVVLSTPPKNEGNLGAMA